MDEFYRMLDRERKDWYNLQIKEDDDQSSEKKEPEIITQPIKKQFDLFDDSSSEEEGDVDGKKNIKEALEK